jgi:hypothetical protein
MLRHREYFNQGRQLTGLLLSMVKDHLHFINRDLVLEHKCPMEGLEHRISNNSTNNRDIDLVSTWQYIQASCIT